MADSDIEEVREILTWVSSEVPKLLNAISDSLFGAEQTGKYAEAVSEFYTNLREAGMDEDKAFKLTKVFMDRTNLAGMLQELFNQGEWTGHRRGDWESKIEKKVKRKIKETLEDEDFEIDIE
ncbi:MAG: hypothetical protein ACE5LS_04580 [Thermoplasmata archaeon]